MYCQIEDLPTVNANKTVLLQINNLAVNCTTYPDRYRQKALQ